MSSLSFNPRSLCLMVACVATSLVLACSGSNNPVDLGVADTGTAADTGGTTDTGGGTDASTDAGDAGTADNGTVDTGVPDAGMMSCTIDVPPDPTPDPGCNGRWTTTLEGMLVDDTNTVLGGALAQTCIRAQGGQTLLCLRPELTCVDGAFANVIPMNARCVDAMIMHAFKPGGQYTDSYCELTLPANGAQITLADSVPVYRTTPPTTFPPEGDRATVRTLEFAQGLSMDVTPNGIFEGYEELSAYELAGGDPAPCFIDGNDPAFTRVFGFAPNLDITGGDWPFTVANSGLAPGTNVNFYVLGGLDCRLVDQGALVEEAHWEMYATGTVSGDGSLSGNLPCLNWMAYAPQ